MNPSLVILYFLDRRAQNLYSLARWRNWAKGKQIMQNQQDDHWLFLLLIVALPLRSIYFSLTEAVATLAIDGSYPGRYWRKNINFVAFLCIWLIKQFCVLLKRNQFFDTDSKALRNLLFLMDLSDDFFKNWIWGVHLKMELWLKSLEDPNGWNFAKQHGAFWD